MVVSCKMAKVLVIFLVSFFLHPPDLISQTIIDIQNPSFEDIPHAGNINSSGKRSPVPKSWFDCGVIHFPFETPPDIHPGGFFDVTHAPSHGNSYLGLAIR